MYHTFILSYRRTSGTQQSMCHQTRTKLSGSTQSSSTGLRLILLCKFPYRSLDSAGASRRLLPLDVRTRMTCPTRHLNEGTMLKLSWETYLTCEDLPSWGGMNMSSHGAASSHGRAPGPHTLSFPDCLLVAYQWPRVSSPHHPPSHIHPAA
jgi:hypothetical protein